MKMSLLKGETPLGKKTIKEARASGDYFINKLKSILVDKQVASIKSSRSSEYDNPNWAYLQADARGYERALEEVINLLEK